MNKLVITKWEGKILTLTMAGGQALSIHAEPDGQSSILGNIYIGKVQNIVNNIHAAFVDIGGGIAGYYSLTENPVHHHTKPRPADALRVGDEIIVQVARDAVKTKAPVLTGNLNFAGRYCVLTAGKNLLGFSSKIADTAWKEQLRSLLEAELEQDFGVIVRTNAPSTTPERLIGELRLLKERYHKVMAEGACRTCHSLLYREQPAFITDIRDSFASSLEGIITDDETLYQDLEAYLKEQQPEDLPKLILYQDSLVPLSKLYGIEAVMERALNRRVWLKSGGYLVIEPTEALVVIDVNTGKYTGRKNPHDTIMKINLEAADELCRQIRLRNLSGIILVDFIDMTREEDQKLLMDRLADLLAKDPVKTSLVDITPLNLVEITRKKVRKPLYELIN